MDWVPLFRRLRPALDALPEPWVLTGSGAFAAQGLSVEVHDLDIQTTGPGVRFLDAAWRDHRVLPAAWRVTGPVRSWLGRFEWHGTVDAIGDIEHRNADGTWGAPPPLGVLRRFVRHPALGHIPVLPLRYEAEAYRRMGRTEEAARLLAWAESERAARNSLRTAGEDSDGPAPLLSLLTQSARDRALLDREAAMDGPTAFRLVRDLPYARPLDNRPEGLIREWRGTCSGKHRLLRSLLQGLGYDARLMIATYRYDVPGPGAPGPELVGILERGPVPDVHTFLEVRSGPGEAWLPLDATWPAGSERIGLPVNGPWRLGESQAIACTPPFHAWEVPPDADPDLYKDAVVRAWCGEDRGRREALIAALSLTVLHHERPAPYAP